jgi:hypothetical protein
MHKYQIRLLRVTGLVFLSYRKTLVFTGTKAELAQQYARVRRHNLLFGWWGIISFIWNIVCLAKNRRVMDQLANLPD